MPWDASTPNPQIDQMLTVGNQKIRLRLLLEPVSQSPAPAAFNVRDRGVRGDGAADDAPAIQRLFDAAKPGDGFYFPSGSYMLGSPLLLKVPQVTLLGDGEGSVLVHGAKQGLHIQAGSALVADLKFLGLPGKYYVDKNDQHGILINGVSGVAVQRCRLNGPGNGIYMVNGAQDVLIQDCMVHGWGSVGLGLGGRCLVKDTVLVQDDPAKDQQRSNHGVYIFAGAANVTLENVAVMYCRKMAVHIYGEDPAKKIGPVTLRGVRVVDSHTGIVVANFPANAARAQQVRMLECNVTGCYSGPGYLIKQGDGVEVADCTATQCGVGFAFGYWANWEANMGLLTGLRAPNNTVRNCQIGFQPLASNGGRFQDCILGPNLQAYDTPRPVVYDPTPGLQVLA